MAIKQHDLSGQFLLGTLYTPTATGTDVVEGYFFIPDATGDYTVNKVVVIGNAALSGTDDDYASVTVQDGGTAGTGTTQLTGASEDFTLGTDIVAGTPITLTASGANVLDGADVLRCRVTKTGSGATIPALVWHVYATGS